MAHTRKRHGVKHHTRKRHGRRGRKKFDWGRGKKSFKSAGKVANIGKFWPPTMRVKCRANGTWRLMDAIINPGGALYQCKAIKMNSIYSPMYDGSTGTSREYPANILQFVGQQAASGYGQNDNGPPYANVRVYGCKVSIEVVANGATCPVDCVLFPWIAATDEADMASGSAPPYSTVSSTLSWDDVQLQQYCARTIVPVEGAYTRRHSLSKYFSITKSTSTPNSEFWSIPGYAGGATEDPAILYWVIFGARTADGVTQAGGWLDVKWSIEYYVQLEDRNFDVERVALGLSDKVKAMPEDARKKYLNALAKMKVCHGHVPEQKEDYPEDDMVDISNLTVESPKLPIVCTPVEQKNLPMQLSPLPVVSSNVRRSSKK